MHKASVLLSDIGKESLNLKNVNTDSCLNVPPGSQLFHQGSRAAAVYSIQKGLVKLTYEEESGKQIIAAIRYPGWLLAASAVILDELLPVTAITITPCSFTRLGAEEFRCLIKNDNTFSWNLHRMMAREIHNQMIRLNAIECLSARQRLEELIWQLISATESISSSRAVKFQFPVRHSEIAQVLAVSPQYLSWMIGQMEKDQIITRDKGWLHVHKPEMLWHREELKEPSYCFRAFQT